MMPVMFLLLLAGVFLYSIFVIGGWPLLTAFCTGIPLLVGFTLQIISSAIKMAFEEMGVETEMLDNE